MTDWNTHLLNWNVISAAWELRVNENATTIQGICVLTDVCFLIVELCFPQTIYKIGVVRDDVHSVSRCVEVIAEVVIFVLLSVPDTRALLCGHFESMRGKILQGRIIGLSQCLQTILREFSELLCNYVRCLIVLRCKILVGWDISLGFVQDKLISNFLSEGCCKGASNVILSNCFIL